MRLIGRVTNGTLKLAAYMLNFRVMALGYFICSIHVENFQSYALLIQLKSA